MASSGNPILDFYRRALTAQENGTAPNPSWSPQHALNELGRLVTGSTFTGAARNVSYNAAELAGQHRGRTAPTLGEFPLGGKPEGLTFNHIAPPGNPGLRHITASFKDGTHAGHISYHQLPEGGWMVQQIRVPENLRRQGIATQLFGKALQDTGGKLRHQNDPALLSPEGAQFAQSFEHPAPSAAAVRAQLREPLQGTGPGKPHGAPLQKPSQARDALIAELMGKPRYVPKVFPEYAVSKPTYYGARTPDPAFFKSAAKRR